MKKKFAIINFSLMMTVLFSMLFQSFHSYEHLAEKFSTKICNHEKSDNKAELTHHHHISDHCFVCEFTFSPFFTAKTIGCNIYNFPAETPYFFSVFALPESFSGSLYSLRGPPIV